MAPSLRTLPFLVLAGCACTPLDAIPITNTAGAPPSTVALVEAGIAEFAAWTGREAICVPEIEIVDEVPDRAGGHGEAAKAVAGDYSNVGGRIRVEARWEEIDSLVRHELCHALDADEAIVANDRAAFTGLGASFDDEQEVFAVACAQGPRPVGLLRAVEACGAASAVGDLLAERVFTGQVDAPVRVGGAPTLREAWRPTDDWTPLRALVVGEALWLFGMNDGWTAPGFRRVDPSTGAVLAEAPLYAGSSELSVVPADDTLRLLSEAGGVAWDGADWIAAPLPGAAAGDAVDPVVSGGRVWFADADRTALYTAVLPDGEPEAVPGLVPAEDWAWATGPLVAAVDVDGAPALARLDGTWTVRDLPDGLVGTPGGGSDDGAVAAWEEMTVGQAVEALALPDLTVDDTRPQLGVLLVHGEDGATDAYVDCTAEAEAAVVRFEDRFWALADGALNEVVLGD